MGRQGGEGGGDGGAARSPVGSVARVGLWLVSAGSRPLTAFLAVFLVFGVLAGIVASQGTANQRLDALDDTLKYLRIGTGTTGGTYFPIGGIIASAISSPLGAPSCERGGGCGVPGTIAVAQASTGSVENVESLGSGTIELGLSQADIAFWAYSGTGPYDGEAPRSELRAIARLFDEAVHVVVPAASPARSVADLGGLRVSVGTGGSGTLAASVLVLEAHGIGIDGVEAAYLPPEASAAALLSGELDAVVAVGGVPMRVVDDLARRMPIRLLPLEDAATEALLDEQPFLSLTAVPEGSYDGVDRVATLGVGALLVTSLAIDEATVFGITQALMHPTTLEQLTAGHARGAEIRPETATKDVPVPLHPGAERYYRAVGLIGSVAEPVSTRIDP